MIPREPVNDRTAHRPGLGVPTVWKPHARRGRPAIGRELPPECGEPAVMFDPAGLLEIGVVSLPPDRGVAPRRRGETHDLSNAAGDVELHRLVEVTARAAGAHEVKGVGRAKSLEALPGHGEAAVRAACELRQVGEPRGGVDWLLG